MALIVVYMPFFGCVAVYIGFMTVRVMSSFFEAQTSVLWEALAWVFCLCAGCVISMLPSEHRCTPVLAPHRIGAS